MKLAKEERETIIRASAADTTWDIWTDDPKIERRMARNGWKGVVHGSGQRFSIPLRAVTIRKRKAVMEPKRRGGSK